MSRGFEKCGWIALGLLLLVGLLILPACTGPATPTGEAVTVNLLIRTEDERQQLGDYLGDQLEGLGFNVTRQYGTSSELSPIWLSDPADGTWNAYTGSWLSTSVSRDEGSNFGFFYTPFGGALPVPCHCWPWEAYTPTPEFLDVAAKLWHNNFTTIAEREALFREAIPLSLEDSVRIFVADRTAFSLLHADIAVAADAAGGICGSSIWAPTIHYRDGSGAPIDPASGNLTVRMAATDLFIDPWNPVAGSNWACDMFPIRATGDNGFEFDPRTGLQWPHRAVNATVTWVDGLPIVFDADHTGWLTANTMADPIPVPDDCWVDFDATTGEFLTTADVFGSNVTALTKTVVNYPDSIWTVPMHDGSVLDESDFLFYTIMQFVRADPNSPLYDPGYVRTYEALMSHFKGVEFEFNPEAGIGLRVTTYDDSYYLDAELIAGDEQRVWFPSGDQGPWAWHTLALGILAESDLVLCFSHDKATDEGVEWCSFISGPSLAVLENYLDDVRDSLDPNYGYIPFSNVLGPYVSQSDALTRYSNLDSFYTANGNFWVGTGPYYLASADTLGNVIQLENHSVYPDAGDMWFFTMDPVPTTPPSITGGWVDTITIEVLTQAEAITQLGNDEIDVCALSFEDADLFAMVQADSDLTYYMNVVSLLECAFNPVELFNDGSLNPFGVRAVREALNRAIDRDYIVRDIMGGLGIPRYTCIGTNSGDAMAFAGELADVEAEYAYDFAAADAEIEAAMLTIDGVTREDGKYYYLPPA